MISGGACAELGQLVHAVIHRQDFAHVPGKSRHGHRVIKPLHRVFELPGERACQKFLHQAPALGIHIVPVVPAPRGKLQAQQGEIGKVLQRSKPGDGRSQFRVGPNHLDEEDFMSLAQPRDKLLRPLPNPIPAQMAMDDQRVILLCFFSRSAVTASLLSSQASGIAGTLFRKSRG